MRKIFTLFIIVITICSCKKEYGSFYDPPAGQEGQIYQQLVVDTSLSIFVRGIDRVPGLTQELSSSGLFTVIAPDNTAFRKYLKSKAYASIDDVPVAELTQLIKFHVLKYMLFSDNFMKPGPGKQSFEIFKYETRANTAYQERSASGKLMSIYYPSKMIQIYTPNYFSYYSVTAQDYSDVFGPGSAINGTTMMNIMGASVTVKDVAAGNGVFYKIDKVLEANLNIAQNLDTNPEYSDYAQLMKKYFLTYSYNNAATRAQGKNGDLNGDGIIDSLWTRTYFNPDIRIDEENPVSGDGKTSLSFTALIPSKAAFAQYMNTKVLPVYDNNKDSVSKNLLKLLYRSHFIHTMEWPGRLATGNSLSVLGDKTKVVKSDINSVKMTSNGLLYTLNRTIEPGAFTAVTGPAFFAKKYSLFIEMLVNNTNLLPALTLTDISYTLLVPTNQAFSAAGIFWNEELGFYRTGNVKLELAEMERIIGNQVIVNKGLSTTQLTNGWYRMYNSTFIEINNGIYPAFLNSKGPSVNILDPNKAMTNGYFHGTDRLMMPPPYSIAELVNSPANVSAPNNEYIKFKELCSAAGLDIGKTLNPEGNKRITLFAPSNQAIIAAQVANLLPKTGAQGSTSLNTAAKLRLLEYLRYFFVLEQDIFNDGNIVGTFSSGRNAADSTPLKETFRPVTITWNGSTLVFSGTAKVDTTKPTNRITRDGVVHLIDDVLISQY